MTQFFSADILTGIVDETEPLLHSDKQCVAVSFSVNISSYFYDECFVVSSHISTTEMMSGL